MRALIITFLLAFSQISFAAPVENDEQLIKDGIKITLGYLTERESIDPNLIFTDHIIPVCMSKSRCNLFFKILRSKLSSGIDMDPMRVSIFKNTAMKFRESYDDLPFYGAVSGVSVISSLYLLKVKDYSTGLILSLISALSIKKVIDKHTEVGEFGEAFSNIYYERL